MAMKLIPSRRMRGTNNSLTQISIVAILLMTIVCAMMIQESNAWAPTQALLKAEKNFVKEFAKSDVERRELRKAFRTLKKWARNRYLVHKKTYSLLKRDSKRNAAEALFLKKFIADVKSTASNVGNKVKDATNKATETVKSAAQTVKSTASNVGNKVKETVKSAAQTVKSTAESVKLAVKPPKPEAFKGPFYSGSKATWMGSMKNEIGDLALNRIILPGTHDSFTQHISPTSAIAPNSEDAIQKIHKVLKFYPKNIFNVVISNWAKAQRKGAYEQLLDGIRYFDMRVCKDKKASTKSKQLKMCHTFYSGTLEQELDEIAKFMYNMGPKEVIILDFNHLYEMSSADHTYLFNTLKSKFKLLMANSKKLSPSSTLKDFWQANQRIIVLYDNQGAIDDSNGLLWSQNKINSQWPNVQTTTDLFSRLNDGLKKRSESDKNFFVSQGMLTPDGKMIAMGVIGKPDSLLQAGDFYNPTIANWISTGSLARKKLNIVIVDNYSDNFVGAILQQNKKKLN